MAADDRRGGDAQPIDLDTIEIQILCLLRDETLWKKQIAARIDDWSTATVHRRIERLYENGLVTSCIKQAGPEHNRDFFIAFTTTDKGAATLDTYLVCDDPDCSEVARQSDHLHNFVPVKQYYC